MKLSHIYQNTKAAFSANQSKKKDSDKRFLVAASVVAAGAVALMPGLALAAPWDSAASNVLAIFTGGLARTIAIIAVIACGIAAVAGKLSWDWAIKIIIGLVLIFGATAVVDYIISAVR